MLYPITNDDILSMSEVSTNRPSNGQSRPSTTNSSVGGDEFNGGGDTVSAQKNKGRGSSVPFPPSHAKHRRSDYRLAGGLEGQLTNEKLRQLEAIFEEADEDGGGGLDQVEFRKAMRQAISHSLTDHELDIMFMKV